MKTFNNADTVLNNYNNNIKNLKATFAVEGMSISAETAANLKRLSSGKATCSELVEEIKDKYSQDKGCASHIEKDSNNEQNEYSGMTDDEKVIAIAEKILKKYKKAFEELAK